MTAATTDSPRLAAVELLLKQRLRSLFFDVRELRLETPVLFKSYGEFCRETNKTLAGLEAGGCLRDGFTMLREDGSSCVILYNDAAPGLRRRNFTLAHELGHICLGHRDDNPRNEADANAFASELLLPSALIAELASRRGNAVSIAEICEIFAASPPAASLKLEKVARRRRFDTERDRKLLMRFGGLLPQNGEPVVDI